MGEEDADWERAHLRVEGNEWRMKTPTGRERTREGERRGGGKYRLGDSALESGKECVEEGDSDWERAHLRVKGNEWRRKTPTGRERT